MVVRVFSCFRHYGELWTAMVWAVLRVCLIIAGAFGV